jgi:PilZ domain
MPLLKPAVQPQRARTERRRAERLRADLEAVCQPITGGGDAQWAGKVRNISRTGIAVALKRRFERGALLAFQLEDRERAIERRVFARVIHTRAESKDTWVLGCVLAGELSDEELRQFQADRPCPAEADHRAGERPQGDRLTAAVLILFLRRFRTWVESWLKR